jgi:hypothetical protein
MLSYGDLGTRFRALRCSVVGTTDVSRWADANAFDDWDQRTRLIADLIPAGASVIEFGAGRRLLENHLDPSSTYVPSDIVSRGPDTIVLDLNRRPLPDLGRRFDVAVLAGVLEYIHKLPSFAIWLASTADAVIASYTPAKTRPRSLRRLRERYARAGAGWVNSFSEAELLEIFAAAGLRPTRVLDWRTDEGDERIFHCLRS